MKYLERLIVPLGVITLLTVYYTLGHIAAICLAVGLGLGSIIEILDMNKRRNNDITLGSRSS